MPTLTRDQVKAWNKDSKNGFSFAVQYFLFHNEKTLEKKIDIGNGHFLVCHLMYRGEFKREVNAYRQGFNVPTFRHIPCIHFADYYNSGSVMVSHGLGYWHNLGEAVDKKSYSALQKLSADWTDEKCLGTYTAMTLTKVNEYA